MSRVVMLGSGNVATHLSLALQDVGYEVLQVWSRRMEMAQALASELHCQACDDLSLVVSDADIYLYALRDDVIGKVSEQLGISNGLHLHTAGSVSIDVFARGIKHRGVLYPFQTFSKSKSLSFKEIPILIEANGKQELSDIETMAHLLSDQVYRCDGEQRSGLHLSGVFACNFTNHMFVIAKQLLERSELPFNILLPLIKETIAKLDTVAPEQAQTGPAVREDVVTMEKQRLMLDGDALRQEIYTLISEDIIKSKSEIKHKIEE